MANSATQQFEEKQRKVGERSHLRVPFVYEGKIKSFGFSRITLGTVVIHLNLLTDLKYSIPT